MSDLRSGSLADLDYHDIIALYNDTAAKHSRMVSDSTTFDDELDDRKGELRYDFRFGSDFDRRDTSFKPLRGRRDRNSAFPVASARILCSLSPEPSPPTSPSSHPPPPIFEEIPKTEHVTSSHSALTPLLVEKHHGLYCRIKTFLIALFSLHPDTTVIKTCSHKFHYGRCKKCDLPEAILPTLGVLQAGFHCKEDGCEGCSDCMSMLFYDTYGSDEDLRVAPLRIQSSIVASLLYADTSAVSTRRRLTISDEAPQIGPIDFIPIAQHIYDTSDRVSRSSISSTDLSFDSFLESSPTPYTTPEPFSSPTDYSLSAPPYLPTHNHNTSTPCPRPIVVTKSKDSTPSPRSTESSEVLEVNVPATAVPIVQVLPTRIRIRHSRAANQPPKAPREVQNFHEIAHHAVHGHVESQIFILKMYQEISSTDVPSASLHYNGLERNLVRKTRLILGLQVQKVAGRIPGDLVEKVSVQLLAEDSDEAMPMEALAAYIRQTVVAKELSKARATQILALAEDDGVC